MGATLSHCGLGPLCPCSKEGKKGKKQKEKKAKKTGETNLGLEEEGPRDHEKNKNTAM